MILLFFLSTSSLFAQTDSDLSRGDSLILTSGWNQKRGKLDSVGSREAMWEVVSDPDPETTEPRPVFAIEKHPAWYNPFSGSQWIGPYPTAMNCVVGTYVLRTRFRVGEAQGKARLHLQWNADDSAVLYLNGVRIGSTSLAEIDADISRYIQATNELEIHLVNTHCEAMGLDMKGGIFFGWSALPRCGTDSLRISTGWDQRRGGIEGIGEESTFWEVRSDPDPETTEPRPAQVIEKYPDAWADPFPGSQWISSYPTSTNYTNGTYLLTTSFCAKPNAGELRLELSCRADDSAAIFVNGHYLGSTSSEAYMAERTAIIKATISQYIKGGRNRIEVHLVNVHSFGMGLNIAGWIIAEADGTLLPISSDEEECRFCREGR